MRVVALTVLAMVIWCVAAGAHVSGCSHMTGCTPGQPIPPGSPVDVGIKTAACILAVSSEDLIAGKGEQETIDDCIRICGATAVQIATIRNQQAKSRDIEKYSVRDCGADR